MPESGYTHCACRDCFNITVAGEDFYEELCAECARAECDGDGECQAPGAYGMEDSR